MVVCLTVFFGKPLWATPKNKNSPSPELIVLLVVDQMRYDYLFSYPYIEKNGIILMRDSGIIFHNAFMDVFPSHTAVGHATISTGSYPNRHGIIGNNWWDFNSNSRIYCVDDDRFTTSGSSSITSGKKSPNKLLVPTFLDEIIQRTGYIPPHLVISIKDRSAILLAGKKAKNVFWFDDQENRFITSSFYRNELPEWLEKLNKEKVWDNDSCYLWQLLLPPSEYLKITGYPDDNLYEGSFPGEQKPVFPHNLRGMVKQMKVYPLGWSPCASEALVQIAISAMRAESSSRDPLPFILAISFSSTDIIGHMFGTHSWGLMDTYLRLDIAISRLISYIKENYKNFLIILTADHGAYKSPVLPENAISPVILQKNIERFLKENLFNGIDLSRFKDTQIIKYCDGYHIVLNDSILMKRGLTTSELAVILNSYKEEIHQGIREFFPVESCFNGRADTTNTFYRLLCRSVCRGRSPHLFCITDENHIVWKQEGTSHGSPYPSDTHIPLIIYSPLLEPATISDTISITLLKDIVLYLSNLDTHQKEKIEKYIHYRRR